MAASCIRFFASALLVTCTISMAACSEPGDDQTGDDQTVGGKADDPNSGPYAELVQIGDGSYYVRGPSGVEYAVDVMLGSNPAVEPPIIYLSGIAARLGASAEDPFIEAVRAGGHSVVKLMLPAQGETLLRDIENTGGASIDAGGDDWILPNEQAEAVIDFLDAVSISAPVHLGGVSYGGAISAATKDLFPDRVAKVMLMAPHSTPQASNTDLRDSNYSLWKYGYGWVPGAKTVLSQGFGVPPVLGNHSDIFYEALYEIWIGVDEFPTPDVIRTMDDVHVLAVPGDTDGPPELLEPAMQNNPNGTYTLAEGHDGQHFITGEAPQYAADWMLGVLAFN